MKVAVVGGGSTYTPELVQGFGSIADRLGVDELVLQDSDPKRLDIVGGAAQRIASAHGFKGHLVSTTDLDAAVEGAAAVLIQIRVGGQAARHLDETIPLRCGCIGQETTGAGGFAKALRTVPVVLEIAERVRRLGAAGAWIIDFTNPVGIVTRALLDQGHRAVGLCNVAIGFQRLFAEWLGVAPESVRLGHAGLNHLTWIRSVDVDGEDVLPELLRTHGDDIAAHVEVPRRVIDNLGAVPSYYLRYYYEHDEVVQELLHSRTRAEEVMQVEGELLELYRDPDLRDKPDLLMQRGGAYYSEAAINLLGALFGDDASVQVVDVRNNQIFPQLDADAVIEVP
jgi:6-phospho-beta-glucosidase